VVTYRLKDGNLSRHESTATRDLQVLDGEMLAAVNDFDTGPSVTLQTDVSALSMRTWINGAWRNNVIVQPSTPAAAPAAAAQIPTGLEVTLRLHGNESNLTKIFLLGAA
jgi:general secretion pathway protein J